MRNNNYINITKEWLNNHGNEKVVEEAKYYESNSIKYYVDNKNVILDYSKHELEIATWLVNTLGYEVKLLPRINVPEGIKTADYFFKGKLWDLKEINSPGKRAIDNRINGNKLQSKNYIFDISNNKLSNKDILKQVKNIYYSKSRNWVDKIIIKRNDKLVAIYKRK